MSEKVDVLVVDDDIDMARAVARYARLRGLTAHVEHTGKAAVAWWRAGGVPGRVISDLQMPDGDGCFLARAFREGGFTGRITLMSGVMVGRLVDEAIAAGASDACQKPVDLAALFAPKGAER